MSNPGPDLRLLPGTRWRSTDSCDRTGRVVEIVERYPIEDRFRVRNVATGRRTTGTSADA
ncbi:MAG: hypothetical protein ACRDVE_03110 [Actinocrinis sp.]